MNKDLVINKEFTLTRIQTLIIEAIDAGQVPCLFIALDPNREDKVFMHAIPGTTMEGAVNLLKEVIVSIESGDYKPS